MGNIGPSHGPVGFPKKCRLGPQNGSGSLGPEKLLKIVSCATIKETENAERDSCGGPNGIGGWPPTSTWIMSGSSYKIFFICRITTFQETPPLY